jgi:SAM-dependent methyltransferase
MRLVCPCCLGALKFGPSHLSCQRCDGAFPIQNGVPVMLVRDENWNKKQDEIAGEIEFNTVTVAEETHAKRNAFLNKNSLTLLQQSETDLRGKSILVVGSSMAEAECFSRTSAAMVGLDIVPDLTIMYRDASLREELNVEWVCGDGECLPFPAESFDIVIVRQALHHMIRYYSAISEFFRVTRVGGKVLIIEEPFSLPDLNHPALTGISDKFPLYDGVNLGGLRSFLVGGSLKSRLSAALAKYRLLREQRSASAVPAEIGFSAAEKMKEYIPAIQGDAESLLADKYHRFSAVELIVALRLQTEVFKLFWPKEIGWAYPSGSEILFNHGPNPALAMPVVQRFSVPTTFSAVASKTRTTKVLRSRTGLIPIAEMAN